MYRKNQLSLFYVQNNCASRRIWTSQFCAFYAGKIWRCV